MQTVQGLRQLACARVDAFNISPYIVVIFLRFLQLVSKGFRRTFPFLQSSEINLQVLGPLGKS